MHYFLWLCLVEIYSDAYWSPISANYLCLVLFFMFACMGTLVKNVYYLFFLAFRKIKT
jgi:hypothetical protein